MFSATLGAQPLAQAILGHMATDLDAAALLTYRAAKLGATDLAQHIVDRALQLHGRRGARVGAVVEHADHFWPLFREISIAEQARLPHTYSLLARRPTA